MTEKKPLADKPKAALEDLLLELHEKYYPWYESSVNPIHWAWFAIHFTSLFSGFATAILAALATEETFKAFGGLRVLIVVLPALGAAASTLTVQSRLHDWCRLRENGRRAIQALYNEGRARFAAANAEEEYSSIHDDLVKRLDAIEEEQGAGWWLLASPPSKD